MEKLTIDDFRFLLYRLIFWIVILSVVFYIHLDSQKQQEKKQQENDKCLTIQSN